MPEAARHDIGMVIACFASRQGGRGPGWVLALSLLAGCAVRERTARPEPPALAAPVVTWQSYNSDVFVFEYPSKWDVQVPARETPGLHCVRLHSATGLDGQLVMVQPVDKPGTLPTRMLAKLQGEEPALKAEAFSTDVAGLTANGYRFSFDRGGMPWTGWVVSCSNGQSELCVMGRWPTNATDIQTQWSILTRNLRVKVGGYAVVPASGAPSKESPLHP